MSPKDKLSQFRQIEIKLLQHAADNETVTLARLTADEAIVALRMKRQQDIHFGEVLTSLNEKAYRFWTTAKTRKLLEERLERRDEEARMKRYVAGAQF